MRRFFRFIQDRRWIAAVAVVVFLLMIPSVQAAQQMVAVVITGDLQRYREAHEAFVKILRNAGLTEDKLKIYVQTPNPDPMSWANSLRKAVGGGADLIITYGAPVTLVAKKEAKNVPILFADVYDPVGLGIVKDLAVPGGEISGVSNTTPLETLVKTFIEIKQPKAILALYSSTEQGSVLQVKKLEEQGGKFGFSVIRQDVKSRDAMRQAVNDSGNKADAIFVSESVMLSHAMVELIEIANQKNLPILSQVPDSGDKGALLTLEADSQEQGQLLAVHALQVLGGQKVFTLPVRTPKKVSLVINMKAAETLGVKISFQALGMATRVIK